MNRSTDLKDACFAALAAIALLQLGACSTGGNVSRPEGISTAEAETLYRER